MNRETRVQLGAHPLAYPLLRAVARIGPVVRVPRVGVVVSDAALARRVLTDTASVHRSAWKSMFDGFLQEQTQRDGVPVVPFDSTVDYEVFVDGKPRLEGVRDFLASRDVHLPEGAPSDPTRLFTEFVLRLMLPVVFAVTVFTFSVAAFCVTAPLMSPVPRRSVPAAAVTFPSATVVASRMSTAVAPAFVVVSDPVLS